MEFKSVKSESQIDGRKVTGICGICGNIDYRCDRVLPGAFTKTLKEKKGHFRHLWEHQYNQPPIATITEIREVSRTELPKSCLEMCPEASGGLLVTREYLDTPRGNEVLAGIKSGALNEMSFGYDAVKWDWEDINGSSVRNLQEVELYDTSDVNWGVNPCTVSVKSLTDCSLDTLTGFLTTLACIRLGRDLAPEEVEKITKMLDSLGIKQEKTAKGEAKSNTNATLTRLAIAERQLALY